MINNTWSKNVHSLKTSLKDRLDMNVLLTSLVSLFIRYNSVDPYK